MINAVGIIVAALVTCFATLGASHLQGDEVSDTEWHYCQPAVRRRWGLPS